MLNSLLSPARASLRFLSSAFSSSDCAALCKKNKKPLGITRCNLPLSPPHVPASCSHAHTRCISPPPSTPIKALHAPRCVSHQSQPSQRARRTQAPAPPSCLVCLSAGKCCSRLGCGTRASPLHYLVKKKERSKSWHQTREP